jgi:hypothetical protein
VPALRRRSSRTYLTRNGEFVTVIGADSRESRLVPAAGGYESRAGGFTARLPRSLAAPVELTKGSDRISFSLVGARGTARVRANRAVYRNALAGVDVRYAVLGHTLKESLALRSAAAPTTFAYRVRLSPGLRPRSNGRGGIDVATSTGERLLSLAPPFMVDSSRVAGTSAAAGKNILAP